MFNNWPEDRYGCRKINKGGRVGYDFLKKLLMGQIIWAPSHIKDWDFLPSLMGMFGRLESRELRNDLPVKGCCVEIDSRGSRIEEKKLLQEPRQMIRTK